MRCAACSARQAAVSGERITGIVRPPWPTDRRRLRSDAETCAGSSQRWSLFCRDRNERWWPYDNIDSSTSIDPLLAEINIDPTGIFWG